MDKVSRPQMFENARPRLLGLAYRLLGAVADAEDAVQETGIKWLAHTGPIPDNPFAWMSRVCTNHCLDQLKSAQRRRTDYVGPWLPDHILTEFAGTVEEELVVASSLTTAFLLILERLTPRERAAYLLHDIFSMPFDDIAGILNLDQQNCRRLASRARRAVSDNQVRHVPSKDRQAQLLDAFLNALKSGDTKELSGQLRSDIVLRADSGGKAVAVRDVLSGSQSVIDFIDDILSPAWATMTFSTQTINGCLGLIVEEGEHTHAALSASFDENGFVREFFILRNPEKLSLLTGSKGIPEAEGALRLH